MTWDDLPMWEHGGWLGLFCSADKASNHEILKQSKNQFLGVTIQRFSVMENNNKKTPEQINLVFSCHTDPNSLHPWSSTIRPLKHSRKTKSFPFRDEICARLLSGGLIVWKLQGFCNPTPTWRIIPWRTDVLISMVIVSPQDLGLRDPFQMASPPKGRY